MTSLHVQERPDEIRMYLKVMKALHAAEADAGTDECGVATPADAKRLHDALELVPRTGQAIRLFHGGDVCGVPCFWAHKPWLGPSDQLIPVLVGLVGALPLPLARTRPN